MTVILGTSGWQYKSWKQAFYNGDAQKRWLEHFVTQFQTVEVNNAFYRLPERSTFEDWAARTPDDFVVGVKMSRYLTHIKRLKEPEEPVARFMDRVEGLGAKLGPVLLQFPPNLQAKPEALAHTLDLIPRHVRVACEFRHETWFTDEVRHILERAGAALSWTDSPARTSPTWRTADWGYMRFHQGTGNPKPCYKPSALRDWADQIIGTYGEDDVYVYFNNDPNVCAPRDAGRFGEIIEEKGIGCTRHPNPKSIAVTRDPFEGSIG